jgi:hypothetical protein
VRALKKLLMALGGILLLAVVLFGWLGWRSAQFKAQQEPFVTAFVTDLSRRWDVADVDTRTADALVEQVRTPQGQHLLKQFRQLGTLQSVRDFELRNYYAGTEGQRGVFSFKGTFENGSAVVDITLVERGDSTRVIGFYISGTRSNRGKLLNSQI